MSRFAQVLKVISEQPWAMLPSRFATLVELIELRASGVRMSDEEIEARLAEERGMLAADQRRGKRRAGAVAVIPVYGPIVPRASMFSMMSGATSLAQLRADVQEAIDDEDVASILLDFDSPGGVVDGVPEAAAFLRAARDQKPLAAISNTMCCSAAYWLACQASEISVSPSGLVGSIGVFYPHTEFSKANEQEGITTTIIRAGKYKAEGNDAEPLSDDARAHIQEEVDYYYGLFTADVAAGRGVKVGDVRDGYGQGRALNAKPSLAAGLVDRIETFDSMTARLVKGGGRLGRSAALEIGPETAAAIRDKEIAVDVTTTVTTTAVVEREPDPPESPEPPVDPADDGQEPPDVEAGAPAEFYTRRRAIREREHSPA